MGGVGWCCLGTLRAVGVATWEPEGPSLWPALAWTSGHEAGIGVVLDRLCAGGHLGPGWLPPGQEASLVRRQPQGRALICLDMGSRGRLGSVPASLGGDTGLSWRLGNRRAGPVGSPLFGGQ